MTPLLQSVDISLPPRPRLKSKRRFLPIVLETAFWLRLPELGSVMGEKPRRNSTNQSSRKMQTVIRWAQVVYSRRVSWIGNHNLLHRNGRENFRPKHYRRIVFPASAAWKISGGSKSAVWATPSVMRNGIAGNFWKFLWASGTISKTGRRTGS
ncbi:hypothetical protein SDC9_148449 [bioreactor metagenome]|uniref:Uncharacterized protein n=1 Tax=bioreactor metagenome TaxID=1076179 RepID=A0A645EL15_9ZZZZ